MWKQGVQACDHEGDGLKPSVKHVHVDEPLTVQGLQGVVMPVQQLCDCHPCCFKFGMGQRGGRNINKPLALVLTPVAC